MQIDFRKTLQEINDNIPTLDQVETVKAFDHIPLELFGEIQIDRPDDLPNLSGWFPAMPSADIQNNWTGSADHVLLKQSVSFIRMVVSAYHALTCTPMSQSQILDFGCGWGRLIRLLYKYVPFDNIYGVDPWDRSLEVCRECNLRGNLFLSEYVPRHLPTPNGLRFDLIIAFSVFTHLPEWVMETCIETLTRYLTDNGTLVLSIRPKEYWLHRLNEEGSLFSRSQIDKIMEVHDLKGFSFCPHDTTQPEEKVMYGDASMTLEYIDRNFVGLDIVSVEWSVVDTLQLIVFLKKTIAC